MKKLIIASMAVAFLASPASAFSFLGLEITAYVPKMRCHNITGNYEKIAERACSDNGSGGVGYSYARGLGNHCPYEHGK